MNAYLSVVPLKKNGTGEEDRSGSGVGSWVWIIGMDRRRSSCNLLCYPVRGWTKQMFDLPPRLFSRVSPVLVEHMREVWCYVCRKFVQWSQENSLGLENWGLFRIWRWSQMIKSGEKRIRQSQSYCFPVMELTGLFISNQTIIKKSYMQNCRLSAQACRFDRWLEKMQS